MIDAGTVISPMTLNPNPKPIPTTAHTQNVQSPRLPIRSRKLNDALPVMRVDAETYVVTADGEELRAKPAAVLPLAQRYFLF